MRTFSAKTLAALQSGSVALVQLLKMDFSGTPIYLNSSTWDLVWQRLYNLLRYSEQFENAAWLVEGTSTTGQNVTIAPDGTTTADRLIETTSTLGHYKYQGSIQSAGPFTASFYIKQAERQWASVQIATDTITKRHSVLIDLANGNVLDVRSVGSPISPSYSVIGVGGGWYRVSVTATNTSGRVDAIVAASNSATPAFTSYILASYTGDITKGIYVWGAQLEPGELATTYTPTTVTALTDPGLTYKGAFGLGQISAITDKPGEVQGINLELHGADAARISLALDDSDIVQGTPVEIRTALIDTTTYQILDAPVEWVGTMDTMSIAEDGTSATIAVTCESKAVDLLRGNVAMYSDADQRAINPTDASFSYVVDQIDKPIVWPSREFFYK